MRNDSEWLKDILDEITLIEKYSSIQWRDIISMRNFIVHQYFGVDLEEIWNTIMYDIPTLKNNIIQILKEADNS